MNSYPRGSEWRKWDLHVHPPGTKLSDGYDSSIDALGKFCDIIETSDVEVIGITDYFSVDKYFEFILRYKEKYPESTKVFFPNIELRLNESVNKASEEVNVHVIFPPEVSFEKAIKFLTNLKTEITDSEQRNTPCSELKSSEYSTATITRKSLDEAIELTFGKNSVRQDKLLIFTAANNDGVRPPRGKGRKQNITDQIDKFTDGYFGGFQNVEHFLKSDRLEDNQQRINSKPVFSCSDAHNFKNLSEWLGKSVSSKSAKKEITWVKSNPTFAGLQQTLIEPFDRVKIQTLKPDEKEPYKCISKISFTGTNDFPSEILMNSNLVSIIGSRSSGKSSLLAHIAYSINPLDAVKQQMVALEENEKNKIGPAAGKTWQDVSDQKCKVTWRNGEFEDGRVIYIPQNYLYSISKRPDEITKKIKPVLFAKHTSIEIQFKKNSNDVKSCNEIIRSATSDWFDLDRKNLTIKEEISNLGDKKSVEAAKNDYKNQIDILKKDLNLSQDDINSYQSVLEELNNMTSEIEQIKEHLRSISIFYNSPAMINTPNIKPSISFQPPLSNFPKLLSDRIDGITDNVIQELSIKVESEIASFRENLYAQEKKINQEIKNIKTKNKVLIEKQQKNVQLKKLVENFNRQSEIATSIEAKENLIQEYNEKKEKILEKITRAILNRSESYIELSNLFYGLDQTQSTMSFGLEIDFNEITIGELSEQFNRQEKSPYLKDGVIDIIKARSEVYDFLNYINEKQKMRANHHKKQVAIAILCTTEEIRFNATLEGDKIGGFHLSSMTPGKQALFALTLILDESDDVWPLLIDQPEDDLDSRSIYQYIVPYLVGRKKERQILMATHNANLAIGADSEQVIVANRNGANSQNRQSITFDYQTGAIEDTRAYTHSEYILESSGIREHAIEILDGGKEAFEKRKHKYKL
jgi:hypothetical protein